MLITCSKCGQTSYTENPPYLLESGAPYCALCDYWRGLSTNQEAIAAGVCPWTPWSNTMELVYAIRAEAAKRIHAACQEPMTDAKWAQWQEAQGLNDDCDRILQDLRGRERSYLKVG